VVEKDDGNFYYSQSFRSFAPLNHVMEQAEQQQETRNRIRDQAKQLYMKYGIRSVSMDDIAVGLGMSKKTIYQYFTDKDELVDAIVDLDIHEIQGDCQSCFAHSVNAVEEVFLTMDKMMEHLRNMNPTILYDLHKFHFQSFKKFSDHKNSYLLDVIKMNLQRGIEEGLFRPDLNVDVISRFRLESMMIGFNMEIFPPTKYGLVETTMVLMEHFIFGLVTPKGYELILKYQNERNKKVKHENR
jgi:TetR/AcrR family transcriptional regulator, cholesterol catabolism regulator